MACWVVHLIGDLAHQTIEDSLKSVGGAFMRLADSGFDESNPYTWSTNDFEEIDQPVTNAEV
ncbi:MAG: hypothetical protein KAV99_01665 [Candidatus Latescibacteria bacterium]|nr:hypothetical protein [Candidatus Latescibacterota bacterium]